MSRASLHQPSRDLATGRIMDLKDFEDIDDDNDNDIKTAGPTSRVQAGGHQVKTDGLGE